ncbi:FAD/NAD-P-binding domain-containing protein [Ilyonectria robusta]
MAEEQIASMEPTPEATADYLEHAALWHQRTVFMEPCKSWWKASKSGLPLVFPGSRVSLIEALANLRPEDWKFRYLSGK